MSEFCLVLSTAPSCQAAEEIAREIVSGGLAACVQIVPLHRSVYRWKGQLCSDEEALMLIKTTTAAYSQLETAICGLHSYEVPEIVRLDLSGGSRPYLDWLRESVRAPGDGSAPGSPETRPLPQEQ